ncbi:AAA family ATPase [Xanthomonas vesicatoria]|uniref:AAA family ATPase n=1 Tax=Xanthomonas vesicatoria TaxID=56460 RepID=UPI0007321651|nr:AAA family ATPase [Xanthomonas vesicatoria]KTF36495.1 ATPase [Xanthomonas vesicatoria]MCC8558597.1 AAA family ATPase [Xanthomonas vesicatoria]MCC8599430.1 AAA family ATPase [Xanthomonas vesicatoria]MCC8608653.1 AAA family ATPase [Xanthomonas vesicatoria]MCC8672975.1 AAA family ATPase [Xanthomonas vesicatoria]
MARADQIKALLRAYAGDQDTQFAAIALQMAADEAQKGHTKLAAELKSLVEAAQARRQSKPSLRPVPLAQPKGELADLLTVHYPRHHLSEMVVSDSVQLKLGRILKEQRHHERLSGHGLSPRRKLLLIGPPGTGKTLTANVLAAELRLPLFVARFDSLITKFMGESASKLRLVFEALKATRGVYLFDEFDSLGLQRGSQHDVAEMRRTLNMFLQLIEQDTSESLIVAATNHGDSLDSALFRRFDDVIRYDTPDKKQIEDLLRNSLALMEYPGLDYQGLAAEANGLSHSDIVRACRDSLKDAVLDQREYVNQEHVLQHLRERSASLSLMKFS